MTRQEFDQQVSIMEPGQAWVYHRGALMGDRQRGCAFQAVDNTACAAWAALEAGKVKLFQRRVGPSETDYIAIKNPEPYQPIKWTGCYDPMLLSTKKAT